MRYYGWTGGPNIHGALDPGSKYPGGRGPTIVYSDTGAGAGAGAGLHNYAHASSLAPPHLIDAHHSEFLSTMISALQGRSSSLKVTVSFIRCCMYLLSTLLF